MLQSKEKIGGERLAIFAALCAFATFDAGVIFSEQYAVWRPISPQATANAIRHKICFLSLSDTDSRSTP